MAKDNRIVQSGELEIAQSLDNVVDKPASGAGATAQAKGPRGAFPTVDMAYLNKSLMDYLTHAAVSTTGGQNMNIRNLVESEANLKILSSLGNSFFKMQNPKYFDYNSRIYLRCELVLNPELPLKALKKGIAQLMGDEYVEYFLQEFGDRFGAIDETKTIDATNPELQRYLPNVENILNMQGDYILMRDPFLLLLLLDPAEREYITLFFNEAKENNAHPFDKLKSLTLPDIQPSYSVEAEKYALKRDHIQRIIEQPQIIPLTELLRIGKKYDIRGLAEYADRLEKFREILNNIKK